MTTSLWLDNICRHGYYKTMWLRLGDDCAHGFYETVLTHI